MSVIDALFLAKDKIENSNSLDSEYQKKFSFFKFPKKKIILITGHRRENLDGGLENICKAVKKIANLIQIFNLYTQFT